VSSEAELSVILSSYTERRWTGTQIASEFLNNKWKCWKIWIILFRTFWETTETVFKPASL